MSTVWHDVRFGFRTLRRNLGVTVLAVVSLGLAIAGNTTVFSMVSSFLFRPLPYEEVERLVFVGERNSELLAGQLAPTSAANFLDFAERQSSFVGMAAVDQSAWSYDAGGERPEELTVGRTTPGFFRLLGADLAVGRLFAEEEAVQGSDRVVLVSHRFWIERLGGRDDLAGETLKLNGWRYDVVGVLGEGFEFLLAPNVDLWAPLPLQRGAAPRGRRVLFAIARLADGVTQESAQAEMDAIMAQLVAEHPEINRGYAVELLNMRHDIPDARNRLFFHMLQGALLFVLLIACANVANMLLARGHTREREMAVRSSLGASRRRVACQLLVESLVMASLAGALGVGAGYVGMRIVNRSLASFLPEFWMPTLDHRVLLFSLAVTLVGGLLFGLTPVSQLFRFDLLGGLKDGSQASTAGSRKRWIANGLVVAEIALALGFLAGAGMLIRSFQRLQGVDPGFETENLLIMRLDLPDSRYGDDPRVASGARQALEVLTALPGVEGAAVSNLSPRTPFLPQDAAVIEGLPPRDDVALPQVGWLAAGTGYFETIGIPLLQGRGFTAADDLESPKVMVVNRALASRYWPEASALGERLQLQGEIRTVIGVVADVRHDVLVTTEVEPVAYLPWFQQPDNGFGVALRTAGEPEKLIEVLRRELTAWEPSLAITQVQSLEAFVEQFWVGQRVFTAILGGFGLLALVLAALGTYGVLAYSVTQRTHEIGIRMAIGASQRAVIRMVGVQGLTLAGIGLVLGLPLVWLEARLIASIMQGIVPVEPSAVLGVAAVLTVVTLLASAVPAHRASSIDPIRALRTE